MSASRRLPALGLVALLLLVVSACTAGPAPQERPTATASTSGEGTAPSALLDGAAGAGSEWRAAPGDGSPWVQLTWDDAQPVTSVEVAGPVAEAFDPAQSTAAALFGTLRFSDGSSVPVSGIDAGSALPTTVAFPVRSTTFVRLELQRQVASATVGLRELTAHLRGTRAAEPTGAAGSPTYSVTPAPATCDRGDPVGQQSGQTGVALVCPAPGSAVTDEAVVEVAAAAGSTLVASVPAESGAGGGAPAEATAVADERGRATFRLRTGQLPQGPFVVTVRAAAADDDAPLHVQLFHDGGEPVAARSSAPADMTLQFEDDFDAPLSVSQSGAGARYAALKPEPWGGSQFGDSVFADPAWGADTLATLPGGYLRIRNQPIGDLTEHQTWDQQHAAGLLSSQRFGGSGFSAQYGYFEARVLGAPGPGAWSAFWMMNSQTGTARNPGSGGELDVVELYGHAPRNACHATHSWGEAKGSDGVTECLDLAAGGDWASQWHTYGARIVPGGAELYVDGEQVAVLDQLSHTDEPFFFMFDLATGGGWPVDLGATGGTSDLYVDWVRVYT